MTKTRERDNAGVKGCLAGMFPALWPRLVNNKKLQQFTINPGRDEIRGGRGENNKTKYPPPPHHHHHHHCNHHYHGAWWTVVINVVIFIDMRHRGGNFIIVFQFFSFMYLIGDVSSWSLVVVSERRVVARQTEGEEEQQDSGDYKLRGEKRERQML